MSGRSKYKESIKLEEGLQRELAVRGSVCPKSIAKVARGEPVRGMAGHRARAVLIEAGILRTLKQEPDKDGE